MSMLTREELIEIARWYYPAGFPVEKDDYRQPLLAHQRTPEHERWREAWKRALAWEQWDKMLLASEAVFPPDGARDATQPWHSACRRCCIYVKMPLPDEGQAVIRIAAAVSVLAPIYVIYVTTRTLKTGRRASVPQLTFEPPSEVKLQVDALAGLMERELNCNPFPLEFSGVIVPEIRIGYRNSMDPPTLLDALFSNDLANLP